MSTEFINHHEEDEFFYDECETCQRCGGECVIVVCPDDLCHGQDYCMHGDGMATCPDCKGSGEIDVTPNAQVKPRAKHVGCNLLLGGNGEKT